MKTTSTLKTALVALTLSIITFSANSQVAPAPAPKATIEQAGFSATFNDIKADLKWTARNEGNVSHFVIERSKDGVNFQDAAVVFAFEDANNFTYKFSEKLNETEGVVYYRLCTIDKAGKYSYSDVRLVRTEEGQNK